MKLWTVSVVVWRSTFRTGNLAPLDGVAWLDALSFNMSSEFSYTRYRGNLSPTGLLMENVSTSLLVVCANVQQDK